MAMATRAGNPGFGDVYSSVGMQYSVSTNRAYKDVQDAGCDRPDCEATAAFWAKNDLKVYGGAPPPMLTFESANLPPAIMGAIAKAGYESPSVIQAQTWPAAMAKRDVIGVAKTGSGKTLGFLVPGFLTVLQQQIDPYRGPAILVLAPTRELAMQIDVVAKEFGLPLGIRSVCCYGGAPKGQQLGQMRQGCACVIGTPGRVNDFRESGQLRLEQVMYLVMDEADRMLDMGFEPQIRKIISGGIPLSGRRFSTPPRGRAPCAPSRTSSCAPPCRWRWATSTRSTPTRTSRSTSTWYAPSTTRLT